MPENGDPIDAEQSERHAGFYLDMFATAGGESAKTESGEPSGRPAPRRAGGPFGMRAPQPAPSAEPTSPQGPDLSDSRIQQSVAATKELLSSAASAVATRPTSAPASSSVATATS